METISLTLLIIQLLNSLNPSENIAARTFKYAGWASLKMVLTALIYIIKGNVPAEKQSTTFFWEEIF